MKKKTQQWFQNLKRRFVRSVLSGVIFVLTVVGLGALFIYAASLPGFTYIDNDQELTHNEWMEAVNHLFWKSPSAGVIKYTGSIEVGGAVAIGGELQIGSKGTTCGSTTAGMLRYANNSLSYCNGSSWVETNYNSAPETKTTDCAGLPAANASWNTVSSITQTLSGSTWTPSAVGSYNTTASTTECRFKCNQNYTRNSSSKVCVANIKTFTCAAKPTEGTVWNSVSSYPQTRNGNAWSPADSTTTYNTTESSTACRYKCATNYSWNGNSCVVSCGSDYSLSSCPSGGNCSTCGGKFRLNSCQSGYTKSGNSCNSGVCGSAAGMTYYQTPPTDSLCAAGVLTRKFDDSSDYWSWSCGSVACLAHRPQCKNDKLTAIYDGVVYCCENSADANRCNDANRGDWCSHCDALAIYSV